MSKTGKKFNLNTNIPLTANFIVSDEKYDENINAFVGNAQITSIEKETFDYEYVNFHFEAHYEELKEIASIAKGLDYKGTRSIDLTNIDELNLYKFKSKLEYNFLLQNFEENAKNYTSLQIPNFYDAIEETIKENQFKGFEGTSYLEDTGSFYSVSDAEQFVYNIFDSKYTLNNKSYTIEEYLSRFATFKEQFPYYTDISFDVHERAKYNFSDVFNKYNLYNSIFNTLKNTTTNINLYSNLNSTSKQHKYFNFDQQYINNIVSTLNNDSVDVIFDLNSRLADRVLNISQVTQKKQTYSEVIGYHIRKYEGIAQPTEIKNGSPMQHWMVPNLFAQKCEILDSQLIYGKNYTYTINPIVLTISYNCNGRLLSQNQKLYQLTYTPQIKIIDLDLGYEGTIYSNYLLDYPPLEPEMEFIPFIGVANKIKINLNTSVGSKTVAPIAFTDSETANINKLKSSQNINDSINQLTFQADSPSKFFEIYRLSVKPTDYLLFANSLIASVSSEKSSGASIIDDITQNRKYYYIARSVDYHNNVSNPTVIYEVEILNDNGLIIPYIKVVDFFLPEENKDSSRSFKRFLKLEPALRHTILQDENINPETITLGNTEETVWDQRFKIRVTSKKTGKKIDLYTTFKYKKKDS